MNHRPSAARAASTFRLSPAALVLGATLLALPLSGQSEGAAQRFLLQAERLADSGRIDEAIEEYERVVDALPDSPSAPVALLAVARLQLEAERPERALRVAQRLLDDYPSSQASANAAVIRTEVLAAQAENVDQLADAIDDLEALLLRYNRASYPDLTARAEALVLIARLQIRLGEYGPASASLVEVLEDESRGSHTAVAELLFAETLIRTGRAQQAWASLQSAIEADQSAVSDAALAWASALHRFLLRPQTGQPLWQGVRTLSVPGVALKKPVHLASNPVGDLIVIDEATGGFLVRDGQVQALATLSEAQRPLFDGRSPIYVMPASIDRPGERFVLTAGGDKPKQLSKLQAAAAGAFGRLYVLDRTLDTVGVFHRSGAWLGERATEGRPEDLAAGSDGHLHVLTSKPSQIVSWNQRGERIGTISLTEKRPATFDVDLLGNFYVLDHQSDAVRVVSPEGQTLTTIGPILPNGTQLRNPSDVAVDGAGRIYIADERLGSVQVVE